jgi:HlyD family type I secretion membrane fusion protein
MSDPNDRKIDEVPTAADDSEAVDDEKDILSAIEKGRKRLIIWGFLVIVLGIGGLGAWAALAPLQGAALASGTVKVSSERKTVQHLEGGIIKEILVKDGDKVTAGQVLIRLDDTNALAQAELLRGKRDRLLAALARLEAEQAGSKKIVFPAELLERQEDGKVGRLLAAEREVFNSRREALAGEKEVLEQRNRQLAQQVEGLKIQIISTKAQLSTIREEKDAVEILYKKGVYEKPRYLELKRSMARLQGQIGAHQSSISQVEQRQGEVRLRIIDIDKQRREEVGSELQRVQNEIFDNEERLRAALNTLDRTEISATEDGTIVGLNIHTIGGVIRGGSAILNIVPADDVLVVEANLRPQDIDVVHEGMPAEVRLTAFNRRSTPMLPGLVTRVSADSLTDQSGNQSFYRVRVEIDPEHVGDLALYPGMPAEVYLLTGERTALNYLMKPIEDSIRRALLEQ